MEKRPQVDVAAPVQGGVALGAAHHGHDAHGDERVACEHRRRCGQADGGQGDKHRERGDHGVEELGQVAPHIQLELFGALSHEGASLGRAHALLEGRPQVHQFSVHLGSHRELCL